MLLASSHLEQHIMALSQDFGPGIIKQTGSKASFFLARMSPWNSFHAKRLSCQKKTHPNLILHILLQTVGRLEDSS